MWRLMKFVALLLCLKAAVSVDCDLPSPCAVVLAMRELCKNENICLNTLDNINNSKQIFCQSRVTKNTVQNVTRVLDQHKIPSASTKPHQESIQPNISATTTPKPQPVVQQTGSTKSNNYGNQSTTTTPILANQLPITTITTLSPKIHITETPTKIVSIQNESESNHPTDNSTSPQSSRLIQSTVIGKSQNNGSERIEATDKSSSSHTQFILIVLVGFMFGIISFIGMIFIRNKIRSRAQPQQRAYSNLIMADEPI
uniref:General transcription factor II-I repeat domain-containing protein 2A n=2 Tax=Lygus hesperus TaxID=30085 RepID=A0A0A9WF64_LYGHE